MYLEIDSKCKSPYVEEKIVIYAFNEKENSVQGAYEGSNEWGGIFL